MTDYSPNNIRTIAAALRADAAGNEQASMTDVDFAADMLMRYADDLQQRENEEKRKADQTENARKQAIAQVESIAEMVAAMGVDYDRLEELRELEALCPSEAEELRELEEAAGDCESEDEARERIEQDALSVEVRSDWHSPGEDGEPSEFKILLCTGGPAVQIRGELDDYSQPCRAWIEYQDWFTPWIELHDDAVDHDALLTYCRVFYFGE